MSPIFHSATRLVLLAIILTMCVLTTAVVMVNIQQDAIINGVMSVFGNTVIAIVSFYYGQKSLGSGDQKN